MTHLLTEDQIAKNEEDLLKCADFLMNCRQYFEELPNDKGLLATAKELYYLIKGLK